MFNIYIYCIYIYIYINIFILIIYIYILDIYHNNIYNVINITNELKNFHYPCWGFTFTGHSFRFVLMDSSKRAIGLSARAAAIILLLGGPPILKLGIDC